MAAGVPTVVVVDDAADLRALVKAHMRLSRQFSVVGEGATGIDAIELAAKYQPTLLLLDVSMPQMDGLEALPRVLEVSPRTRVVMFTGFDERGLLERARQLGAIGLLEKSVSLRTLAADLIDILGSDGLVSTGALAPPVAEDPPPDDGAGTRPPEDILDEHLERFREVFEEAAIGMGTMTLTGRLVRANKAMSDLVGRPVGALVGRAYADLMTGNGPERFQQVISDGIDNGLDAFQLEHGLQAGEGDRLVLTTVAPVRDANLRPLYLFVQAQDVTGQRVAEEALRQSEERFRLLVEAVNDHAIFMLDPQGYVVSWNSGAQRLKGYPAEEIVGRHFRAFYPVDKQASRHPEHVLEVAVREGRYEEEGWRVRKDGSRFWANVVITAIRGETGQQIGFAKITRDFTEQRRMLNGQLASGEALASANRELAVANERLERAAEDQAQFLAVTAHELRTPIGVLCGSTDLLREHWRAMDETERLQLFESISASTARLRRLLDDLLTAARLEAGAVQLSCERFSLNALVANAVTAARRQQQGFEVLLDAPEAVYVLGDAGRLAQAVDNLVNNARQHGGPPVSVGVLCRAGRVEVRVSDGGPGVSAEIEPRLFDRFATGARRGGTGLGLFIVRELARAHGGEAWYERPSDGGRPTFVLSLPAEGSSLR